MNFIFNSIFRRVFLSLTLFLGVLSLYLQNSQSNLLVAILGLIFVSCLFFIWNESSAIFILILLSFTTAYAFYSVLFQLSLPLWLIMVGILSVFSYLFAYFEQRIGILGNKRLVYLVLFSLIILEVFLSLSYFLINPIGQSLIIAAISYLFVGFCYTVLAKHTDNKFITYVIFTTIAVGLVFLTSAWGVS